MSFVGMRKEDLYRVAQEFGVEVDETSTKQQIIAALGEDGVKWEMVKMFEPPVEAEALVKEDGEGVAMIVDAESAQERPGAVITSTQIQNAKVEQIRDAPVYREPVVVTTTNPETPVLVRMERDNPTYMVRGYKFTKEHPFVLVKQKDVDEVLGHEDGFYLATPREAQEFYS